MASARLFSTRRTVSWETESTRSSSTILSASSRNDQRACPSGGWEQLSAIKRASKSPSAFFTYCRRGLRFSSATSRHSSTKRRLTRSIFLRLTGSTSASCWLVLLFPWNGPSSQPSKISALSAFWLPCRPRVVISSSILRSCSVNVTVYRTPAIAPSQQLLVGGSMHKPRRHSTCDMTLAPELGGDELLKFGEERPQRV